MPLPVPNLDDRSYQDLVDELLARIPAHTPEWTNPQPGDPGRTLIELFAWLGDTLLYRVNLIPERQRLAFLRLLGVRMRPALAASALVSIQSDSADTPKSFLLPARTGLKGPVPFETCSELDVLPLSAEFYLKRSLSPDEHTEMAAKIAELSRLYPGGANTTPYVTTQVLNGATLPPKGLDFVASSTDGALWIALLAPKSKTPQDLLDATRKLIGGATDNQRRVLNIGLSPWLAVPDWDEDVTLRPPIPLSWDLVIADPKDGKSVAFLPLTVLSDSSNGTVTDGIVRISLPGASLYYTPTNDVRVDVDAGTGPRPPRIDDPEKQQRIAAWIRLQPQKAVNSLKLSWIDVNAVQVEQWKSSPPLLVGQGSGQPNQLVQLPLTNLQASVLEIQVEEPRRGFVTWSPIDDLSLADDKAKVYELDPEAGILRFGDRIHGLMPQQGARIRANSLRSGGGTAGNLRPGTLTQVIPPQGVTARLTVSQRLPTAGGADAETLEQAQRRIPALLRHRDRAVTADDYVDLALHTPGAEVARAEVLPGFKPQERRQNVPGVVSVMALPTATGLEAPYPRVDRGFIEAVHAQLDPRRPLGTELYVMGCRYVQFALTVGIDNPSGSETVPAAVKAALQRFFFPLPPLGPTGTGWPLRKAVKRRELEVVVSRVDGVDEVNGLILFQSIDGGPWKQVSGDNDATEIRLADWELPELMGVVVTDGDAPTSFANPGSSATDGLAIPVVPEVC
jgi:hypothetical protein